MCVCVCCQLSLLCAGLRSACHIMYPFCPCFWSAPHPVEIVGKPEAMA